MHILDSKIDFENFTTRLKSGVPKVLMLDYDGTLAPFTVERERARPYPEVVGVLQALVGSETTRTIIVSGRTISSLMRLLKSTEQPELWGCHGLERMKPDGGYTVTELDQRTRDGLARIHEWVVEQEMGPFIERKPSGVAFHWRGLPESSAGAIKKSVLDAWSDVAEQYGFELHGFDGGLELRANGASKASAVETILNESAPETVIAYLGDDMTDEDAFAVLSDRGLKVLVSNDIRQTRADLVLQPPHEVVDFLRLWL